MARHFPTVARYARLHRMAAPQRIVFLASVVSIGSLGCEPMFGAEPRTPSQAPAEQSEVQRETGMARLSRECKAGSKVSCSVAANAYKSGEAPVTAPGEIVAQNLTHAAYYWSKGCELGDMWCCENLADANHKGEGIRQDDVEAARLFTRVCEGPLETATGFACTTLGDLYVAGKGVPHDFRKGISLLQRGCSLGVEYGCHLHDLFAGTGRVTAKRAPQGALGLTFGWSKAIAQKTCTDEHGRWLPGEEKDGKETTLCLMRIRALERDGEVGLDFIDGRLATIWAGYDLDDTAAGGEHARVAGMLLKIYDTPSKRAFEILEGCRGRSLATCISEKQATFTIYWEFQSDGSAVSCDLVVGSKGHLALMLMYVSSAGMKAAGHQGL